jgi:ParB family chromosome partitioning protein
MKQNKALGRGLEYLFNNEQLNVDTFEKQIYESVTNEEIIEINVDELRPNPYQPRKHFDETSLNELANSIKEHGIFQPIIVKKSIKGYEIIAGERRWRASKIAGLKTIPAIIRNLTDSQMMEIALLENLQRENLNAIEEAEAYKMMIERLSITQEEVAKKVGKSRSHITNMIGLLVLPKEIRKMIIENKLTMGHARVLSKLEDKTNILELANKVIDENLTVRNLEDITREKDYARQNPITKPKRVNEYKYVEELLKEKLDTRVKIKNKKIEIAFTSTADLNRILDVLNIKE